MKLRTLIDRAMINAQARGVDPYNSQPAQARAYERSWQMSQLSARSHSRSEYTANMLLSRQAE
jgi:hypothetical protein